MSSVPHDCLSYKTKESKHATIYPKGVQRFLFVHKTDFIFYLRALQALTILRVKSLSTSEPRCSEAW